MSLLRKEYYDHPEGQDLFGKMVATSKYAAAAGLSWSIYDTLMLTKTQGYLPTLARIAYNTGPMVGMAAAFTLTTYLATNARHEDDKINYVLGGIAAGAVYGSWQRSVQAGCITAIAFAITGAVKKLSKEEGWDFFPSERRKVVSMVSATDWTLMKDPKDNPPPTAPAAAEAS